MNKKTKVKPPVIKPETPEEIEANRKRSGEFVCNKLGPKPLPMGEVTYQLTNEYGNEQHTNKVLDTFKITLTTEVNKGIQHYTTEVVVTKFPNTYLKGFGVEFVGISYHTYDGRYNKGYDNLVYKIHNNNTNEFVVQELNLRFINELMKTKLKTGSKVVFEEFNNRVNQFIFQTVFIEGAKTEPKLNTTIVNNLMLNYLQSEFANRCGTTRKGLVEPIPQPFYDDLKKRTDAQNQTTFDTLLTINIRVKNKCKHCDRNVRFTLIGLVLSELMLTSVLHDDRTNYWKQFIEMQDFNGLDIATFINCNSSKVSDIIAKFTKTCKSCDKLGKQNFNEFTSYTKQQFLEEHRRSWYARNYKDKPYHYTRGDYEGLLIRAERHTQPELVQNSCNELNKQLKKVQRKLKKTKGVSDE